MEDYRTSSASFREYLKINNIAWEDCEVEILMESIYETPVREHERHLNLKVFKDDEFCWSRNTKSCSQGCLKTLYRRTCRDLCFPFNSDSLSPEKLIEEILFLESHYASIRNRIPIPRERTRLERARLLERERLKRESRERARLLEHNRRELERLKREGLLKQERPDLFDWCPTADFT